MKEDVSLLFLEDALSFCCHGNTVESPENLELLLVMVEVYLVWRLDPPADSTKDNARSRKVSGVYLFMGNVPPVKPEPDDVNLSERHSSFLQNFLFYTKKLLCSDAIVNTLGTGSSSFDLLCSVVALGGTFLKPDQKQLMQISQKWAKVFVKKDRFKQEDVNSSSRLFYDLLAKLKSGNFQSLEADYRLLSSYQNKSDQSESTEFLSLKPSSYFPTNQWRVLLEEVLGYRQWADTLRNSVVSWEGGNSSEYEVSLVTMNINLQSVFILVDELLKSGDNSPTKSVRNFGGNSQFAMTTDTVIPNENQQGIRLDLPKSFAMGYKRTPGSNVFQHLQTLLQPVINESQALLDKLSEVKTKIATEDVRSLPLSDILTRINDKSSRWEGKVLQSKHSRPSLEICSLLEILTDLFKKCLSSFIGIFTIYSVFPLYFTQC